LTPGITDYCDRDATCLSRRAEIMCFQAPGARVVT